MFSKSYNLAENHKHPKTSSTPNPSSNGDSTAKIARDAHRPDVTAETSSTKHSDDSSCKKVQFNNPVSLPTLSTESSDAEEAYHDEFDDEKKSRQKRLNLKKLASYPYNERMQKTKSIDSQLSDLSLHLPEFNKRPLTDTPIVSSVTSPDIASDENTEDDRLSRMKNISHLNLSDMGLNLSSISPNTSKEDVSRNAKEPRDLAHRISGLTMTPSTSQEKIVIGNDEGLQIEIPAQLQRKFEKTESLEKLKSLLNTKPNKKAYTLNIPGQTSSKISPDGRIASVDVGSKLVIVMVGLPARGKSYITNKLTRYLNWLQHDCRVFNVGNTRRLDAKNNGPENRPLPDTNTPGDSPGQSPVVNSGLNGQSSQYPNSQHKASLSPQNEARLNSQDGDSQNSLLPNHDADFFSPDNSTYTALREKWAMDTLDQLLDYVLKGNGSVGIFDATNSTKRRRNRVLKRIQERSNGELKVLFLESICTDPAIIEDNIRLKLSGPDYKNMDPEVALKDFVGRLHNYEKAYEPIDDVEEKIPGFQYVKMIDVGKKVVSYNVQGFLASQTIYFLLNFNLCERQIWITRHGESVDNLSGRIGGDSVLTKRGHRFARTLAKFMDFQRLEFRKRQLKQFSDRLELRYSQLMKQVGDSDSEPDDPLNQIPSEPNFYVWTSMLVRAIETGQYFDDSVYSIKEMRMLNELGGGKFEGMTYEEIQHKFPKEYLARIHNKLTYRYPGVGGESYLDVLTRLRPLITEIERTTDHLLIVSHRVVLRILLAYFLNLDKSAIGELDVPLHTLYCLESKPYGTVYHMYEYDEGLDWFVKVEPEHQKNVKEVGVLFKQRKYSVIPTAPPLGRNDVLSVKRAIRTPLRRSVSQGFAK